MFNDDQRRRYEAAAHAMQTGVAVDQGNGSADGSAKHLRVGVNSALMETSVLARLLVAKGVVTEHEYAEAMVEGMEAEATRYAARVSAAIGVPVTLG